MATRRPGRYERGLALLLLFISMAAVYWAIVYPLWLAPMNEVNRQIHELLERDRHIQIQLQQAPEIERRLQEINESLATHPGFLPEPTFELASAGLAQRLESAVHAADPEGRACAINSRSPLPQDTTAEPFTRVAVRVHLRCGVAELATVLYSLEAGQPRLFAENVNLLAQTMGSGQESSGGVEASFDLMGYLAPGALPDRPTEVAHEP